MPKYVIEREIPGAGKMTPEQFEGRFPDFLRSSAPAGAGDSVGPQLCDRRQDLLHLYCAR